MRGDDVRAGALRSVCTRARARTHARTHARANTHTHARACTHSYTHSHARAFSCVGGDGPAVRAARVRVRGALALPRRPRAGGVHTAGLRDSRLRRAAAAAEIQGTRPHTHAHTDTHIHKSLILRALAHATDARARAPVTVTTTITSRACVRVCMRMRVRACVCVLCAYALYLWVRVSARVRTRCRTCGAAGSSACRAWRTFGSPSRRACLCGWWCPRCSARARGAASTRRSRVRPSTVRESGRAPTSRLIRQGSGRQGAHACVRVCVCARACAPAAARIMPACASCARARRPLRRRRPRPSLRRSR